MDLYHNILIYGIKELLFPTVYSTLCLMTSLKPNLTLVEVPYVIDLDDLNEILKYNTWAMPMLVVNLSSHSFVGFVFAYLITPESLTTVL